MSHFTVLTAITLPEGVEDLLSQSSIQMSVCELAQATHSADIANKLKTNMRCAPLPCSSISQICRRPTWMNLHRRPARRGNDGAWKLLCIWQP